jgi:hypothetical protein
LKNNVKSLNENFERILSSLKVHEWIIMLLIYQ